MTQQAGNIRGQDNLINISSNIGRLTYGENTAKRFSHASLLTDPAARFSKVPIINGPGELSPFTLKIEFSIVLHLTR